MPIRRLFRSEEKTKKSDPTDGDAPGQQNPKPSPLPPGDPPHRETAASPAAEPVFEKDNRAARISRPPHAGDFWKQYEGRHLKMPFLRYVFDTELQARGALLAVGCIHLATDTGLIVCTEPITLGCYRMTDGRYEVFLAGNELSYETWSEAARKFSDHHGQFRDQLKPETDERFKERLSPAEQVVHEREYYQITPDNTSFLQVFRAPSAHAARAFLLQRENMITVRNRSIRVETPEAILCRDFDGIHEIKKEEDSR